MTEQTVHDTHGPYRIVRNKDGEKTYFAGHHTNGQERWVSRSEDAVHYPDPGLAGTVQRAIKADTGETLNVVRITG